MLISLLPLRTWLRCICSVRTRGLEQPGFRVQTKRVSSTGNQRLKLQDSLTSPLPRVLTPHGRGKGGHSNSSSSLLILSGGLRDTSRPPQEPRTYDVAGFPYSTPPRAPLLTWVFPSAVNVPRKPDLPPGSPTDDTDFTALSSFPGCRTDTETLDRRNRGGAHGPSPGAGTRTGLSHGPGRRLAFKLRARPASAAGTPGQRARAGLRSLGPPARPPAAAARPLRPALTAAAPHRHLHRHLRRLGRLSLSSTSRPPALRAPPHARADPPRRPLQFSNAPSAPIGPSRGARAAGPQGSALGHAPLAGSGRRRLAAPGREFERRPLIGGAREASRLPGPGGGLGGARFRLGGQGLLRSDLARMVPGRSVLGPRC